MKLFCAMLCATALLGQQLVTLTDRQVIRPGEKGTIQVSLAGQTTPTVAALQFVDAVTGSGITLGIPTIAQAAQQAGKQVACGAARPGICLVFGVGTTPLANAGVVDIPFSVSPQAPAGEVLYRIVSALGATGAAGAVSIANPADLKITITAPAANPLDLNSDGRIDLIDINIVVQQAVGNTPVSNCDVNGDSACNVRDVQLVAAQAQ